MHPNVSVIVPVYNGQTDLPELLDCLRSQTYPAQCVEYLIVDNNSSDRTMEILHAATRESSIALHPVSEAQIQSSYAARNAGIRAATADLLVFTDADCRPQPHWLEALISPFTDREIGLVVGEIKAFPAHTLLECHAERQDTLSQKHTLNHGFCPYGQTANLAVRRQAFLEVGLFRPYLTTGGDADLCWRILKQTNWQLKFAEDAVVRHRHRATLKQLRSQWRRYGESNRYLHQLHGVDLMPEKTPREYAYRLAQWLVKEVPKNTLKAIAGRGSGAELLGGPLGILTARARELGQREAQLPESARSIEWIN
ncbi:glycosyltransferase [Oscillatoriales cyanobacterium LEGE 11467]|uniref:Glycosyltransferase n=1 Tax=Zarconia navalis LEGE 11467 TaxID=1828826 RepID=A0A928VV42_9CYAN|nr:glycosyltransferase [Zarconia navalis]MBE9040064.1 glycosyltransferase [Zarconia navalis LEGE 11467]